MAWLDVLQLVNCRSDRMSSVERYINYRSLDQGRRFVVIILPKASIIFVDVNGFHIFFSCRSNNLASLYYLLHIWCSRSLCVMVPSSLSCNEVPKRAPFFLFFLSSFTSLSGVVTWSKSSTLFVCWVAYLLPVSS